MLLTKTQQVIVDTVNEFMRKDTLNLFIEPPNRKFFGLNYSLLSFLATFKNEKPHFNLLVYVVDTNWQAKEAYELFCKLTEEIYGQCFYVKGGNNGSYKIRFTHDGPLYRFVRKGISAFGGWGPNIFAIYNLTMFDEPLLEPYFTSYTKSVWIVRGSMVSDPNWREERMKTIPDSYFCIFK